MPRRFESVGDRMPKWEPACRLRVLRPSVTRCIATQAKMRKKCSYGRGRTWVNVAVRPYLRSFLTHKKHHLFENKVWEIYIFIKKCIRSLLKLSLPVNDNGHFQFTSSVSLKKKEMLRTLDERVRESGWDEN